MTRDELHDLKALARYLQLHEDTVYRLVQRTYIPMFRIGRRWRWSKSRIDAYLDHEIQRQTAERASLQGHSPTETEE